MPLEGSSSTNPDKTVNYSLSGTKDNVSVGAFVNGYRHEVDPMKPNAPQYSVAGGSIGVGSDAGHSVGLTAQHIPNRADQITASGNLGLLRTDNHKVDVNAFNTTTIPKAGPNFNTHGAGVDYAYKDKFGANASVTHTPMFKQTEYGLGGRVNLHQTPTSSLDLNLGTSRTDTAFGRGNWQKGGMLTYKKHF